MNCRKLKIMNRITERGETTAIWEWRAPKPL